MAVFSVNLVRQFYVVDGSHPVTEVKVGENKGIGGIQFKTKNALGKDITTDIIDPRTIEYIHLTDAGAMATKLSAVKLTVTDAAFPDDKPIPGLDYVLRINFSQLYGMSDEDIYQKYGAVHAYSGMEKSDFFAELLYSLTANLSREHSHLLDFYVGNAKVGKVTKKNGTVTVKSENGRDITDIDHIIIAEADQSEEWVLGVALVRRIQYKVIPTTVTEPDYYNEITWGKVEDFALTGDNANPIPNSKVIADMEYFYHGYRGDQYRMKGWPDVIPTKPLVDPEAEAGYDVLDIQYAYLGDNEDIQKSAKTLTFVAPHEEGAAKLVEIVTAMDLSDKFLEKKARKVAADGVVTAWTTTDTTDK